MTVKMAATLTILVFWRFPVQIFTGTPIFPELFAIFLVR
jgi:hypothetical protein